MSDLIKHTRMCNVQIYVTYKISNVTYVTHDYEMFSVRSYVTCENIIYPKLCYTRKHNVWCQNLNYVTYTKMCNVHFSLLFQNLDLGITSADDKLHLAIPVSSSCQC